MTIADQFSNGIKQIVDIMGTKFLLIDQKGSVRPIIAAITTIGRNEGDLINVLGIEGRIIYTKPIMPPPEKFDKIMIVAYISSNDWIIAKIPPTPSIDFYIGGDPSNPSTDSVIAGSTTDFHGKEYTIHVVYPIIIKDKLVGYKIGVSG